jgi:hypothetical protein
MKSKVVGWPYVMILFKALKQNICERQCFTVSELLCELPQMSCTVLYEIITVSYAITSFTQDGFPKMLMNKMQRMASALTSLSDTTKMFTYV